MDSFSVTLTKLKGRRLSRKPSGSYFGLERVWVRSVVRGGGFEPHGISDTSPLKTSHDVTAKN
jgi:hypothetical protein